MRKLKARLFDSLGCHLLFVFAHNYLLTNNNFFTSMAFIAHLEGDRVGFKVGGADVKHSRTSRVGAVSGSELRKPGFFDVAAPSGTAQLVALAGPAWKAT